MAYTLSASAPPSLFKLFKKTDGPEDAVNPGKNPSFALQVVIELAE